MNIKLTLFGILMVPLVCFAQEKTPELLPDTLVIEIKPSQKVLLIGNDLKSFQKVALDSIVGRALNQVKDSLATADKKVKTIDSLPRTRFINRFEINIPLGAALIRNTVVPSFFLELEYAPKKMKYYSKKDPWYTFLKLGFESYYFYERRETKHFNGFNNSFLSFSIGNRYNTDMGRRYKMAMYGLGLGILQGREGEYFGKNTFKFTSFIQPARSPIILRSEIYRKGKTTIPSVSILYNLRF